jgi:hypothetical protein
MKVINTLFLTASLGLAAAPGARAAVIFNTPNDGYTASASAVAAAAESFRTGSAASQLSEVMVRMAAGTTSGGNFYVQLFDATGTSHAPGALLTTLAGEANPFTAGNYTYSGSYNLAANTDYWIKLGVSSGAGMYSILKGSGAPGLPTVGTTPYGRAEYWQGNWSVYGVANNLSMQISSLSAVPEPSEWAAMSFGVLGIIWVAKRRFMPARSASSPMRAA